MAEGSRFEGNDFQEVLDKINPGDDDDDNDDDKTPVIPKRFRLKQSGDETTDFIPTRLTPPRSSSTPSPNQEIEMQTIQHEQSGLPSYDETNPLLSVTDEEIQRRLDALREPQLRGSLTQQKLIQVFNRLSEEDKKNTNRKSEKFYQKKDIPMLMLTAW